METFISADDARALVTVGELAQFKDVDQMVLPSFNTEVCTEAVVIEGEEVMTVRAEEQGTQTLFVNASKVPKDTWRPHLMEKDWVVLRQDCSSQ